MSVRSTGLRLASVADYASKLTPLSQQRACYKEGSFGGTVFEMVEARVDIDLPHHRYDTVVCGRVK